MLIFSSRYKKKISLSSEKRVSCEKNSIFVKKWNKRWKFSNFSPLSFFYLAKKSEKSDLMHETGESLSRKEDSNWLYENFVRVVK
jgi:hypothetical protein